MLPIVQNWRGYFSNHHEGLGTTYERFVLHRYFVRLQKQYGITNLLESPSFGMTGISGINSLWWAREGVPVTVLDHDRERLNLIHGIWESVHLRASIIHHPKDYASLPFPDKAFDLSWNFASLWFVPDLETFLRELARVSRKVIFICIPNSRNICCLLRGALSKKAEGIFLENIQPLRIRNIMGSHGWQVAEEGLFDVPPWPDYAMKKEDLLRAVGLGPLAQKMESAPGNYMCILDYFSGKNKDLETEVLKYGFLENSPKFIKEWWAHHRYLVFVPGG